MSTKAIMPGLKACSAEFSPFKPFNCIKISVSYQKATEEAAITKTLTGFGATVQSCSCSCNILSTQDQTPAAAASDSASVFDQKCWKCIKRGLDWGPGGGPDLIIDDSGNAMFFIHAGVRAEEIYAQKGRLRALDYDFDDILFHFSRTGKFNFFSIFEEGLVSDPMRYHNLKEGLVGVSVGTATGFKRQELMRDCRFFSFPVFDISDFVTKSKVCQLYGICCSIPTKMTISGKTALVCGYDDDASQGCAMALKQGGANVVVAEADPKLATQARLRDFSVINKAHDNVVSEADILMVNFNMDNINVLSNIKNMKNNAVIYNTGPILDHNSSTHVALFEPYFSGMEQIILDDHTAKWVSSDTNKCVILVRSPVYDDLTSSVSATSHVVAMLEFVSQKETGKYGGKVYDFPEHLAEKVTDLHLGKLKAAVAKRETEGQAADPVPSQERANPFTTTTADAMNMNKMLIMLIQAVPIIGALVYALTKVSKAELSFSAVWGGGN